MLPREMLSVRRKGDAIHPVLAPIDDAHRDVAREVVAIFAAHEGRTRAELDATLRALETRLGTRFKLARGIATLLERRCRFAVDSPLDPAAARRAVYEEGARLHRGASLDEAERRATLAAAAARLGATPDDVAQALAADADSAQRLDAFDAPPDVDALLARYNLALVQTLLFDATRVEVELREGFRTFLALVKLHGLMHTILRDENGAHRVVLDGPASVLQDTRRYGTSIAKVLPALGRCGTWRLHATIQERGDARERTFAATHETLPIAGAEPAADADAFDSEVERRFARGWASLRGPWQLVREPAAIQGAGGELFIPDFGFAWRGGKVRAHLEIVGFWTPAYLARKIGKLAQMPRDVALLLAVDATLGVGEDAFADAPADVLLYKGDVPLASVVQWLKAREAEAVAEEAALLVARGVATDAPVLRVPDLARAHDVSVEAVERALPSLALGPRVRLGDALVAPEVVKELEAQLAPGMPVSAVDRLAADVGIADTSSLLAHLGYVAAWAGLDPGAATIRRRAPQG